ncbi:hypothetical protein [Xanthomonas campestris]|uniref:Uncharacterized protein n=1 Tax=Xanthomonas campestris pv. papavericola TaxID=487881 RepID=A0AAJ3CCS0_XANCA|nr:hypothetical protein [Xanthomonas campestris]MEC3887101.1 hypothetical protein [Xanthomonas campestris pv. papavericola]
MMLMSVLLAGCAGGTPDCGDTDALQVLDRAIEMEVKEYASQTRRGTAEEFMGILENYEITNIRTLGHDADVDSYQCDARITYVFQERKKSVDFAYRVDTDQADGNILVEYQKKMLNPIFGYAMGF